MPPSRHPPTLQSRHGYTKAPRMHGPQTRHSWTPGPRHVTPHRAVQCAPGQLSSSASPGQWQGQRARRDRAEDGPTDPPDPDQSALPSETICSGGGGPQRALGQKQPAPGWPRAGLWGLPGQEARLAFPLQPPAPSWAAGDAGLRAQTLPNGGPGAGGRRGGPWDLRGQERGVGRGAA